jgi:F0F1-type ATP synthase assembly protein I
MFMHWFYHGWEFTTILLASIGLGWFLDNWLQTRPWFIITFTIIGAIGGFIKINAMIKLWLAQNGKKEGDSD